MQTFQMHMYRYITWCYERVTQDPSHLHVTFASRVNCWLHGAYFLYI